jgi:hypothetical protein
VVALLAAAGNAAISNATIAQLNDLAYKAVRKGTQK